MSGPRRSRKIIKMDRDSHYNGLEHLKASDKASRDFHRKPYSNVKPDGKEKSRK